jgi:hypothetical protein
VLVAGVAVIGISSLIGGLAQSSGVLIGARVAQGRGIGYEDPPRGVSSAPAVRARRLEP